MDAATIIGLVSGSILLGWAIFDGSEIKTFVDVPSVLIVGGGSLAAALISFPLRDVLMMPKVLIQVFLSRSRNPQEVIKELVRFAEIARRDGILSLEAATKDVPDKFFVSGIQMAVDGSDPELIQTIMDSDLESMADRHAKGKALLDNVGKYAPAFGMIGTLIGLVKMLANMSDPSSIGAGMAVALLTTLYGALVSNMVALPMADKLAKRSDEELMIKNMIIRGVMAIQSGDNPRVVEQKLKTFLPLIQRASEREAA